MVASLNDFTALVGPQFPTSPKLWWPDGNHWTGKMVGGYKALFREEEPIWLSGGLTFASNWGRVGLAPSDMLVAKWNNVFLDTCNNVLSPKLVKDILLADLPQTSAVLVNIEGHRINITVVIHDGNFPLALARRSIFLKKKCAYHKTIKRLYYPGESALSFPNTDRDDIYISQPLIRNFVRLYRLMGIESVLVTAGWSAGGAVWPKFGFRPRNKYKWKKIRFDCIHRFYRVPKKLRLPVASDFWSSVKNKETESIFKVSDLSFGNASHLPDVVKRYPHDLNGHLLQRLRWKGILNLSHKASCERLEKYLARKGFPF